MRRLIRLAALALLAAFLAPPSASAQPDDWDRRDRRERREDRRDRRDDRRRHRVDRIDRERPARALFVGGGFVEQVKALRRDYRVGRRGLQKLPRRLSRAERFDAIVVRRARTSERQLRVLDRWLRRGGRLFVLPGALPLDRFGPDPQARREIERGPRGGIRSERWRVLRGEVIVWHGGPEGLQREVARALRRAGEMRRR